MLPSREKDEHDDDQSVVTIYRMLSPYCSRVERLAATAAVVFTVTLLALATATMRLLRSDISALGAPLVRCPYDSYLGVGITPIVSAKPMLRQECVLRIPQPWLLQSSRTIAVHFTRRVGTRALDSAVQRTGPAGRRSAPPGCSMQMAACMLARGKTQGRPIISGGRAIARASPSRRRARKAWDW